MFFLNQLLGTVLVQPDWDANIQWAFRYVTLGASVYVMDVVEIVNHMEKFYG